MEAQDRSSGPAQPAALAAIREKREAIVLQTLLKKAGSDWASATPRQRRNQLLSGPLLTGAEDRLLSAPETLSGEQKKLIVDSLSNAARQSERASEKTQQGQGVGQRLLFIVVAAISVAAVLWSYAPDFVKQSMEAALNKDVPPELIASARRTAGSQDTRSSPSSTPVVASASPQLPPASASAPLADASGPSARRDLATPVAIAVSRPATPEIPPKVRERAALNKQVARLEELVRVAQSRKDRRSATHFAVEAVHLVAAATEGVVDAELAAAVVTRFFDVISTAGVADRNAMCDDAARQSCRLSARMIDDYDVEIVTEGAGERMSTLVGHDGDLVASVISSDGTTALTGSRDRTARVWHVPSGRMLTVLAGHDEAVTAVALSRDAKVAATGSSDKFIRLWDAATGRMLRAFRGHQGPIGSLEFSGDGRRLLSVAADGVARLWNTQGDVQPITLGIVGSSVILARFSPDGQRIAALSQASTVQIWNAETGVEIAHFTSPQNMIRRLAFSPDGGYLATATWEGEVALWETAKGRFVAPIMSEGRRIETVLLGQAGDNSDQIRAITTDGAVLTYPMLVSLSDALAHALSSAGTCFDPNTRASLGLPPDVPAWCTHKTDVDAVVARIWRVYDGGVGPAPPPVIRAAATD